MARFRYSRWDGSQDPFADDMPASDVLEELSDDILTGDSPDAALRRLMRRGMQGRFSGLDSLRSRLQQLRDEEQTRLNLAGPLEELRQRLDEILDRERSRLGHALVGRAAPIRLRVRVSQLPRSRP